MQLLSVFFILLNIAFILLGGLIGYRRGTGRNIIRFVEHIIISALSIIISRRIAASISSTVLDSIIPQLPEYIYNLIVNSQEAIIILENIISAVIAVVLMAIIFGFAQLISLVYFKAISTAIVKKIYKKEEGKKGKLIGAAIGIIGGVIVSSFLLSPAYLAIHTVENLAPNTSSEIIVIDTIGISKAFPINKVVASKATQYKISAHGNLEELTDNALTSLPAIVDAMTDAIVLYSHEAELNINDSDLITSSIATIIPHVDRSISLKRLMTELINSMALTIENGGSVMGLEFVHSENTLIETIVPSFLHTLEATTDEIVKENMMTLFGNINHSISFDDDKNVIVSRNYIEALKEYHFSTSLIASLNDLHNHHGTDGLPHEDTRTASKIAAAVRHLVNNDNMDPVLADVREHIATASKNVGADILSEKYSEAHSDIAEKINSVVNENIAKGTKDLELVAEDIEAELIVSFDNHKIHFDETETSLLATCAAKEFMSEKYITNGTSNITAADIVAFLSPTSDK